MYTLFININGAMDICKSDDHQTIEYKGYWAYFTGSEEECKEIKEDIIETMACHIAE